MSRNKDGSILRASLVLDLEALAANYHTLNTLTKKGSELIAVVKSNCYGMGRDAILGRLYDEGCRFFMSNGFEDTRDVYRSLKRHTFGKSDFKLMAFGVFGPAFECHLRLNKPEIVLVIDGPSKLDAVLAYGQKRKVIIHFNIGMNRYGFNCDRAEEVIKSRWSEIQEKLDVLCISSHFSCAMMPNHEECLRQVERALRLRELFPETQTSFSNSAGIHMLHEKGLSDSCDYPRAGGSLYGITPLKTMDRSPLQPFVCLLYTSPSPRDATLSRMPSSA